MLFFLYLSFSRLDASRKTTLSSFFAESTPSQSHTIDLSRREKRQKVKKKALRRGPHREGQAKKKKRALSVSRINSTFYVIKNTNTYEQQRHHGSQRGPEERAERT